MKGKREEEANREIAMGTQQTLELVIGGGGKQQGKKEYEFFLYRKS
jgi:hypothetical protein